MNTSTESQRFRIASSGDIMERVHQLFVCEYKGDIKSAFVFRYNGECLAYLNRCVHMPFRLDCEATNIFDATRDRLKCSMHGIVFDPESGTSLSPTMCTGDKLTPVRVLEEGGSVWLEDPNVTQLLNGYIPG